MNFNQSQSDKRISQLAETDNDEKNKTFIFSNEGHTLGNVLKLILMKNPNVIFCGYTVPHPAESRMHLRIQMSEGKAIDALRTALEDVAKLSDHILNSFDQEMESFTNRQ